MTTTHWWQVSTIETSSEQWSCCWPVTSVLQVEIKFETIRAQISAVILSWIQTKKFQVSSVPPDKIIVLAPPTKRKHPAPPQRCSKQAQHTSKNERLVLLSNKVKARIPALPYFQLLPHAALQQRSTAHCPRNKRLLLLSKEASLFHSSYVIMLLAIQLIIM